MRTREYLTEKEVERLIDGCQSNRWPHRDQTMILLAFRHGLRASEVCDLQWTQIEPAMPQKPNPQPPKPPAPPPAEPLPPAA